SHREVRQVSHPNLIRPGRLRPPHLVRMLAEPPVRPRFGSIQSGPPRPEPAFAHQPFHASVAETVAAASQVAIQPWTAIRPPTPLEDRTHLLEQFPVLPLTPTLRPPTPRVEPRSRHAKQPAQPRHSERFPFLGDEREDGGFRAEVNRMSFFKSACSS